MLLQPKVRGENYHNFVAISKLIFGLQHTVLLFCGVDNLILILSEFRPTTPTDT
jgi:hypothetical protein